MNIFPIVWVILWKMAKINGSLFIFDKGFGVEYNSRGIKKIKKDMYIAAFCRFFPIFQLNFLLTNLIAI